MRTLRPKLAETELAHVVVDPALEERRLALETGQQVRAATDRARFSWEYVRYGRLSIFR